MLVAGIPVVIATRAISGATLEETYAAPGAEIDLIDRGVIPVGRLAGLKARVRLLVGLGLGLSSRALFPVR
jgi:L-asparaginase